MTVCINRLGKNIYRVKCWLIKISVGSKQENKQCYVFSDVGILLFVGFFYEAVRISIMNIELNRIILEALLSLIFEGLVFLARYALMQVFEESNA